MENVASIGEKGLRENDLDGSLFEVRDTLVGRDFPISSQEAGEDAGAGIAFGEGVVPAGHSFVRFGERVRSLVGSGGSAVFLTCFTSLVAGEFLGEGDEPPVECGIMVSVQRPDRHVAEVKHLKGSFAHGAMIDDCSGVGGKRGSRINEALPADAVGSEALGMLLIEERFRFAVAALLAEEAFDVGATVVDHAGGGVESEFVTRI